MAMKAVGHTTTSKPSSRTYTEGQERFWAQLSTKTSDGSQSTPQKRWAPVTFAMHSKPRGGAQKSRAQWDPPNGTSVFPFASPLNQPKKTDPYTYIYIYIIYMVPPPKQQKKTRPKKICWCLQYCCAMPTHFSGLLPDIRLSLYPPRTL